MRQQPTKTSCVGLKHCRPIGALQTYLMHIWCTAGLHLMHCRPTFDALQAYIWCTVGLFDELQAYIWCTTGLYLMHYRPIFDALQAYIWCTVDLIDALLVFEELQAWISIPQLSLLDDNNSMNLTFSLCASVCQADQ